MSMGKMTKTKYPGVYRRNDARLVVRVTARTQGGWAQKVELQPEGTALEGARRRAEVLRQRVQEEAEKAKQPELAPASRDRATAHKPRETVGEYLRRWFQSKAVRIKPSTKSNYEDALWDRIIPRVGHLRVCEVSRQTIEDWVSWAERQKRADGAPYAKDTLSGWWRVFRQAMQDLAADYDMRDPTVRIRAHQSNRSRIRETKVLTDEELSRFLEGVKQYAPQHYVAILTIANTGMRPGEVYALKWDSVDLQRGEIHVRRAISKGKLVATPKTGASRIVVLHPLLAEALREHRKAMMQTQHPGLAENWVFPSIKGGMRLPQSTQKAFRLAMEAAHLDLRVGPQVLRRTMNTLMIRAGVDRIVLRSMMGHCSEEMTQRYAGVDSSDKKAAILKVFPVAAVESRRID